VVLLTFAFIGISLLAKKISEYIEFMGKSNIKYKILDYLGKKSGGLHRFLARCYIVLCLHALY
jgi:hypothetical protein